MAWQGWKLSKLLDAKGLTVVVAGAIAAVFAVPYKYLDEQTNLMAAMSPQLNAHGTNGTLIIIENVSINRAAAHHIINVVCLNESKCLPKLVGNDVRVIATNTAIESTSQTFNQVCVVEEKYVVFAVNLLAGDKVELWAAAEIDKIKLTVDSRSKKPPCDDKERVDTHLLMHSETIPYLKASVLGALRTAWDIFMPAIIAVVVLIFLVPFFAARLFRRKQHAGRKRR
jgi:hypothetical protein